MRLKNCVYPLKNSPTIPSLLIHGINPCCRVLFKTSRIFFLYRNMLIGTESSWNRKTKTEQIIPIVKYNYNGKNTRVGEGGSKILKTLQVEVIHTKTDILEVFKMIPYTAKKNKNRVQCNGNVPGKDGLQQIPSDQSAEEYSGRFIKQIIPIVQDN